eukprot:918959-Prorocentrum_minimum.AAC.1
MSVAAMTWTSEPGGLYACALAKVRLTSAATSSGCWNTGLPSMPATSMRLRTVPRSIGCRTIVW